MHINRFYMRNCIIGNVHLAQHRNQVQNIFFPLLFLGHETSFDGFRQKRGSRKFHFCFICANFSVFSLKRYWKNVGKVNIIMDSWIEREKEQK